MPKENPKTLEELIEWHKSLNDTPDQIYIEMFTDGSVEMQTGDNFEERTAADSLKEGLQKAYDAQ